jgi:preprotein translocase subunit Sss1
MGNVNMTPEEFEAMLDRAAKKGARAALEELGLHDQNAEKDLEDLRSLLSSWRETKKAMWSTVVKVITTGILLFLVGAVGFYVKNGAGQ